MGSHLSTPIVDRYAPPLKGKGKREKGKGKREGFVKIQIGIDPYLRWTIYDGPERKWPPLAIEGLAIYLLYRR